MPPLAAAGAAIAASVTAAGVMTGLMVVGTGLQLAGKITGSKTLGNIGMGMSLAGGVGSLGMSLSNAAGAASTTGSVASAAKDSQLQKTLKSNTQRVDNPFKQLDEVTDVSDNFKSQAKGIGSDTGINSEGGGMFSDMKSSLMKYDRTANLLGGAADAYMNTRGIQAQKDMQKERLQQDRDLINEERALRGAGSQFAVKPGIKFNQQPLYQAPPLLRTQ